MSFSNNRKNNKEVFSVFLNTDINRTEITFHNNSIIENIYLWDFSPKNKKLAYRMTIMTMNDDLKNHVISLGGWRNTTYVCISSPTIKEVSLTLQKISDLGGLNVKNIVALNEKLKLNIMPSKKDILKEINFLLSNSNHNNSDNILTSLDDSDDPIDNIDKIIEIIEKNRKIYPELAKNVYDLYEKNMTDAQHIKILNIFPEKYSSQKNKKIETLRDIYLAQGPLYGDEKSTENSEEEIIHRLEKSFLFSKNTKPDNGGLNDKLLEKTYLQLCGGTGFIDIDNKQGIPNVSAYELRNSIESFSLKMAKSKRNSVNKDNKSKKENGKENNKTESDLNNSASINTPLLPNSKNQYFFHHPQDRRQQALIPDKNEETTCGGCNIL